ncbi:ABC transporter ATP-binding protein [Clostridium sp. YIM B02505]|uniref:ABC transporter ATP-binding protein n=1 Tax=Clostridium yunnanense TaxID=2800325 RepID=A0ABS1ESE8_9CLOT|nr:ABC transporter ATP-binding protein [Clostridium yunnanense]MBK1812325.1 ABC transporter ATP-binding protein [Clostridium yunnanense]
MDNNNLLQIKDLKISFKNENSFLQVVRGVDIELNKGEILGILGESGSGKTVTASSILRLIDDGSSRVDSGSISFEGTDLLKLKEKEMRKIRGRKISYIFQDSSAALDPYKKIGDQLKEVLKIHNKSFTKEDIIKGMQKAGIENADVIYDMYKSQLSGGLCQRVGIAMATLCSPQIIIADEPTTAIDASLQKKVLELLKSVNENSSTSILLITHDIDVVKHICHKVVVMYGGLVMEEGPMEQLLDNPLHPYSRELLRCVDSLDTNDSSLYTISGSPLQVKDFKDQCPFYERCKYKNGRCESEMPNITSIGQRKVRCFLNEDGENIE